MKPSNLEAGVDELEIEDNVAPEFPALTDKSLMRFGEHKDTPLGDVPASYLLWLADEWEGELWPDLRQYIESNRTLLVQNAANEDADYECVRDLTDDYDW